jgi:hypothetical protein
MQTSAGGNISAVTLGCGFNSVEKTLATQAILLETKAKTEQKVASGDQTEKTEAKNTSTSIEVQVKIPTSAATSSQKESTETKAKKLEIQAYEKTSQYTAEKAKGKLAIVYNKKSGSGTEYEWEVNLDGKILDTDSFDDIASWKEDAKLEEEIWDKIAKSINDITTWNTNNLAPTKSATPLKKLAFIAYFLLPNEQSSASETKNPVSDPNKKTAAKPKKEETSSYAKVDVTANRKIDGHIHVISSLSELQKKFDASLGISVPTTSTEIKLDLSTIQKQSTQELYYVIELCCAEKTHRLLAPFQVDTDVQDALKKGDLDAFFRAHGDSFIDSITYGRWAFIVIQFKLSSMEHKHELSAKLKQTISPVSIEGTFSHSLQKNTTNEQYTIHLYTGGLDYAASGIITKISDIDALVKKISMDEQKAEPAQISWTFQSYETVARNDKSNGQKKDEVDPKEFASYLNRLTVVARKLRSDVEKCGRMAQMYLNSLNYSEVNQSLIGTADRDLRAIYDDLNSAKDNANKLSARIVGNCLNVTELRNIAGQVSSLINFLKAIKIPSTLLIPLKQIPWEAIQHVSHSKGEFHFNLNLADGSDWLKLKIVDDDGAIKKLPISELRLKQRCLPQKKPAVMTGGKKLGSPKTLSILQEGDTASKAIPVFNRLSRLYIKPYYYSYTDAQKENNKQKFNVNIYFNLTPNLPVLVICYQIQKIYH